MSSIFKKKGGLAFKPKIRPRPSPAASAPTAKSIATQDVGDSAIDEAQQPGSDVTTPAEIPIENDVPESSSFHEGSPEKPPPTEENPPEQLNPNNIEANIPGNIPDPTPIPAKVIEPTEAEVVADENVASATSEAAVIAAPVITEVPPSVVQPTTTGPTQISNVPAIPERGEEISAATSSAPETVDQSTSDATTEPTSSAAPTPQIAPLSTARRARGQAATSGAEDSENAAPKPRKRQRKTAEPGEGSSQRKPRKRSASTQNGEEGQATPKRRARSLTPEDAEAQVVDLQQLKMSDLTKDLHIGKKFSRHDELRDRERKARMKAKVDKDLESSGSPGTPVKTNGDTPAGPSASAPAPASGPQFRIVDGQIVVDQSSLVMDRHARAAAAQAGEDMETIEENDFTRLITSNSFMNTSKLKGPNIWTEEETELFYRGLRMFGTDFEIISKMFPRKQRRHIKLKYNREERHCPARVTAAVVGEKTVRMDINEYQAFTGSAFESVESIEAEQRKVEESYEAERKRIADEQAEVMRKKREELFADDDGAEGGGARKKGGKKKKQPVQYGLNGEPIATES